MKTILYTILAIVLIAHYSNGQSPNSPVPYPKIIAYCLDANVKAALALIRQSKSDSLNQKDMQSIKRFEDRFGHPTDTSSYMEKHKSSIDKMLIIYRDYWRTSVLDPNHNYDSVLQMNVSRMLSQEYNLALTEGAILKKDTLDVYLIKYIHAHGLNTTGFGKTGKLYDLLVWKSEKDTTYDFSIHKESIHSKVIFMDDFVTLGWHEYATMDKIHPGGWATKNALYCVRKAYDLKSESFLISYLCHEARHFSDYKLFPKLSNADLEYRAKLTELSMLKENLYKVMTFFINNSNYDSDNGHSVANYCVIRDLSKVIFKTEFEYDIARWKKIDIKKIQDASYKLLRSNTKQLKAQGKDIEKYIKKT